MRTYSDAELERAMSASQELSDACCDWWPSIYKQQIPVTYDGNLLMRAKIQIEKRMADDFAAYQRSDKTPRQMGPAPRLIDWSHIRDSVVTEFWGSRSHGITAAKGCAPAASPNRSRARRAVPPGKMGKIVG